MIYTHAAAAVLALAAGATLGWQVQGWRLGGQIASLQAGIRQAQAAAADRARTKERRLQQAVDAARKERDHAMDRLRAEHAADVARLRERADRPPDDRPQTARDGQAAAGCTGAELYRQDAEFLVGESYRAEATRLGLLACYAQYERARGEVNGGP